MDTTTATSTATTTRPDTDPRVAAIRADHIVGRGSCSFIDECFSDLELAAMLDAEGHRSKTAALRWARRAHRVDVEVYNDRMGSW